MFTSKVPTTPNEQIYQNVKSLKEIFNSLNITIGSELLTYKKSKTYKYEIVFKLADFLDEFKFVSRMVFYLRNQPYKMTFNTLLSYFDYTPAVIKSSNTIFLIRRHILKLNSLIKFGSFFLDEAGVITFHLLWSHETSADLSLERRNDTKKWIEISLTVTLSTLKATMLKLLVMAELIDQSKYNSVILAQTSSISQLPKFFIDDQERLKSMIIDGIKQKVGEDGNKAQYKEDKLPPHPYSFYQKVKVKSVEYHGRLAVGGYASIHVVKLKMMMIERGGKVSEKEKYCLVKVPGQRPHLRKPGKFY